MNCVSGGEGVILSAVYVRLMFNVFTFAVEMEQSQENGYFFYITSLIVSDLW